jgi:hypothetical protein
VKLARELRRVLRAVDVDARISGLALAKLREALVCAAEHADLLGELAA